MVASMERPAATGAQRQVILGGDERVRRSRRPVPVVQLASEELQQPHGLTSFGVTLVVRRRAEVVLRAKHRRG
jgi:hypothetical protein